eukprot:COSAG06_NODE_24641_length_657_cov_0.413978_1_plen_149_part_00
MVMICNYDETRDDQTRLRSQCDLGWHHTCLAKPDSFGFVARLTRSTGTVHLLETQVWMRKIFQSPPTRTSIEASRAQLSIALLIFCSRAHSGFLLPDHCFPRYQSTPLKHWNDWMRWVQSAALTDTEWLENDYTKPRLQAQADGETDF